MKPDPGGGVVMIRLVVLILGIGFTGLASHSLFFQRAESRTENIWQLQFLRFLSGFAFTNVILAVAELTGLFYRTFLLSCACLLLVAFAIHHRRNSRKLHLFPYVLFCFTLALFSVAIGSWTRPYEALISGHDASMYVASGFSAANSGAFAYQDRLLAEMTMQERELFLSKEEYDYSRFRGGVAVSRPEDALVRFGFLPHFSAWLAMGILFLGASSALYLLSFFTALGCIGVYFIAAKLAHPLLGIFCAIALFFFFPQFYYLRFPVSEGFAQTLFLCGLFPFLLGSAKEHQYISAILWGSIFLTRIDSMFFFLISSLMIFFVHPQYKCRWGRYRPFLLTLAAFMLATFFWQLEARIYLAPWGLHQNHFMKRIWMPSVLFLSDLLRSHPVWGRMAAAAVTAFLMLVLNSLLKLKVSGRFEKWISFGGFLAAAIIFFNICIPRTNWERVTSHALWTVVYFQPFVIVLLLAGFGVFMLRKVRVTNTQTVLLLLLLLLPPTIFFILRPLILPVQPLFVRRFIPVVFPLFFLLAFYNWFHVFRIFIKPFKIAGVAFAGFCLALTFAFCNQTILLIQKPLFTNVIGEMHKLAESIPENAIVVIPRSASGSHLELPLQYMLKRDTISIPEKKFQHLLEAFLMRQIQSKRPVFILTMKKGLDSNPLPNFNIAREFDGRMIFSMLARSKPDVASYRTHTEVLRYRGYRILSRLPVTMEASEVENTSVESAMTRVDGKQE